MRAIACGIVAVIIVACSSSSSTDDAVCLNNGGACTTSSCGNQLPYPCDSGGVCCKVATSKPSSVTPKP